MATRKNIYLYTGLAIVGGTVLFIVINRSRKKKALEELYAIIKEKSGEGTYEDLKDTNAFDVNYWRKIQQQQKRTTFLKPDVALNFAKKIEGALGTWTIDDDDKVLGIYDGRRNKVQLSQIAYYFNKEYDKSLFPFLDDFLSTSSLKELERLVNRKPDY